ncbi:MAG: GNAT family N-acetyltransferase [Actinobacteria bacterium]|nr:GNAT family N-acetyltransferase [Actinomycetota bacterium]
MTAVRTATREFRPASEPDRAALLELVAQDPYTNCVLAARLEETTTLAEVGGPILVLDAPDGARGLAAACFLGGNTLPVGGNPDAWLRLGEALSRRRRGCSAVIGNADAVAALLPVISYRWGPPRLVRWNQPLLIVDHMPPLGPDLSVRPARVSEIDRYLPAAAAMFAEELELPARVTSGSAYRHRLTDLIERGRAFVRLDRHGRIEFKAEIGAVSSATAQIQGVWVRPELRNRGIATAALATVISHALELAPSVSLYVNDFNAAARRVYDHLGMRPVAALASVLY